MKKPWRVRWQKFTRKTEEHRDFGTEAKARRCYDRVKKEQYVVECAIFHRVDDAVARLAWMAIEAFANHKATKKEWSKLSVKVQDEVRMVFRKGAQGLLERLVK